MSASQQGCHRSVKLQFTLWPGAESFLTGSVCMVGMHSHECE